MNPTGDGEPSRPQSPPPQPHPLVEQHTSQASTSQPDQRVDPIWHLLHSTEQATVLSDGNKVIVGFKAKDNENSVAGGDTYTSSFQIPAHVHVKTNRDDPAEMKRWKILLDYKYSFALLIRVEIRTIVGTGSDTNKTGTGLWEVYVQQGPPAPQKIVTRIKPSGAEFTVNSITELFKDIYIRKMMAGSETKTLSEVQQQADVKFSQILKFVVGRFFLGVVTDPTKLQEDEFASTDFWDVDQEDVKTILKKLVELEWAGNFCDGC